MSYEKIHLAALHISGTLTCNMANVILDERVAELSHMLRRKDHRVRGRRRDLRSTCISLRWAQLSGKLAYTQARLGSIRLCEAAVVTQRDSLYWTRNGQW
jgi:hypothetical protein